MPKVYEPDAATIAKRSAEIQAGWTATERLHRMGLELGPCKRVEKVAMWEIPEVVSSLDYDRGIRKRWPMGEQF